MSFVLGMMERGQGTVVALVNKGMEGQRPLQKAVLYEHEIPTLGVAAYGLGYWSPQVLVIDLQGTCSRTSPALQRQLASRLGAWARSKEKQCWRLQDFVRRSRLDWRCLDCSSASCVLDTPLAKQVRQLVEALKGRWCSVSRSCSCSFQLWCAGEAAERREGSRALGSSGRHEPERGALGEYCEKPSVLFKMWVVV